MASSAFIVIMVLATFITGVIHVNRRVIRHARTVMAATEPPAIALGVTLRRYAVILGTSAFAILILGVFAHKTTDDLTVVGIGALQLLAVTIIVSMITAIAVALWDYRRLTQL